MSYGRIGAKPDLAITDGKVLIHSIADRQRNENVRLGSFVRVDRLANGGFHLKVTRRSAAHFEVRRLSS